MPVWVVGVIIVLALLCLAIRHGMGARRKAWSKRTTKAEVAQGRASSTTRRSRRVIEEAPSPMRWLGDGATLEVAGFRIKDPHVYASEQGAWPQGRRRAGDPSEIIIRADVRRPHGGLQELPHWPWYSRIDPEHRHAYLEWLAAGKHALPSLEGLLFLYFYGLERRLLVDQQDNEWVLREVVRLRRLDEPRRGTRDGRLFRAHCSGLLWFEMARAPERFNERSFMTVCELTESWNESMIAVPLAWHVHHQRPLEADLAIRVAKLHPRSIQSVVTKRTSERFGELFRKRYVEQHGSGLILKASKRLRRHVHQPANGGLSEVACPIADPTGIPSQFEPLADLWNGCVDDLRELSKVVARTGAAMTAEAWEAMPPELREGTDHPLAERVQGIIAEARRSGHADHLGIGVMPAGALAAAIGMAHRERLTLAQSRRLADVAEHAGHALEPDARMTDRSYAWDELVAAFQADDAGQVNWIRYRGAMCLLRLGLSVAKADGAVGDDELRRLNEHIDASFGLPPHERQRLAALRTLLTKTGTDAGAATRRIAAALAPQARVQVGRLLAAMAAASGGIDRNEMSALRRGFRALGLAPELLDQTIAEMAPASGAGPIAAAPEGDAARGGPIPAREELRLDREAISAIMAETREVAAILAEAMADELEIAQDMDAAPADAASPAPLTASSSPSEDAAGATGPPARYASFWNALAAKPAWARTDAAAVAGEHGVMLDGALESINDWAIDRFGAPAVEEGDGVLVIHPPPG